MLVTVLNPDKFIAEIENIKQDKLDKLNIAVHQGGFKLQAEIQDSIAGRKAEPKSYDLGGFHNSITTDTSQRLSALVYTDLDYPKYLEYGTTSIAPRRHFQNSTDRLSNELITDMKEAVK